MKELNIASISKFYARILHTRALVIQEAANNAGRKCTLHLDYITGTVTLEIHGRKGVVHTFDVDQPIMSIMRSCEAIFGAGCFVPRFPISSEESSVRGIQLQMF